MTLNRCLNAYVLLTLIILINHSNSYTPVNKNDVVKKILDTLHYISDKNDQLKNLIEIFVKTISRNNNKADDCQCVPFYLCNNGTVVKDGSNLLQPRIGVNPCSNLGDICCEPYLINASMLPTPPTTKTNLIQDCGYPSNIELNASSFISNTTSKFGEFPWTILILNRDFIYQCVGSLIHPKVVLTTSHCIKNDNVFTVRAGEWNTTTINEPYGHQNRKVEMIFKHPKFNEENLQYNVALLVLDLPFKLDLNVKTVCLVDEFEYQSHHSYSACAASGWGTDSLKGFYRRVMKKINFSLMSHTLCQSKFQTSRLGKWYMLHRSFVCGMNEQKQDLCTGDGGGPLVCPIQMEPLRYQQVGITSWGLSCDGEFPSVFTDVSYVRNWIDERFYYLNLTTRYYTY
ncbi:hypothetical protein RN001_006706 [Aquatica leii]|uniref:Peptidase S1 domain-containing protein n=1 Tax=Aquatica leii TaxID=1421715 RepID=A0AAN7Q5V2_9COLE|nr:hypothetical protein RN001_006706 [Aquatica leii]